MAPPAVIRPHPFQDEASESPFHYFEKNTGNPLIAMPTGTGKSVVIGDFICKVFKRYGHQKIVVLTHVKELIRQNYSKLLTMWRGAPAGINSAGLGQRDLHHPILFGGIASMYEQAQALGHVDLILIDECHLVSDKDDAMYASLINGLRAINPHLKVIGLSATPWRMGLGPLTDGELFTDYCFDITHMEAFNRLIVEGYLSPLTTKRTETELDTDGVSIRGQEFVIGQLQAAVDREGITKRACEEAYEAGKNRKSWLTFCTGVEHTIHTAEQWNKMGVRSCAIYNGMPDRDKTIEAWKQGYYKNAVNNNMLTTGVDHPAVDFIIGLRPTMSPMLHVQMNGRGTRCVYAPGFDIWYFEQRMEAIRQGGKVDCLVMDFAHNTRRLGPINDPVLPRKKGNKPGDPPIKICEHCSTYNHASVRHCGGKPKEHPQYNPDFGCGQPFPLPATKLKETASTEDIVKMELPQVEVFKIDHIEYRQHTKEGSPPSMRVTYYCGMQRFKEFICIEHPGPAGRKARHWWHEHSNGEQLPLNSNGQQDTLLAIASADKLRIPTHLRVWVNKKYPQILAYDYNGTEFGRLLSSDSFEPPSVEVVNPKLKPAEPVPDDDDIPF
jgi:DNA repair protein RadD